MYCVSVIVALSAVFTRKRPLVCFASLTLIKLLSVQYEILFLTLIVLPSLSTGPSVIDHTVEKISLFKFVLNENSRY